ncbi:hypothetical protein GTQ34_00265 [Muricauda sp. JGD-17]|uniref:Activator of Hsp90 ATPase homologue 1/2-like C-terminal domain-containing protein n=1 Tax=Flagellimonas ochracea TaxID=2696472 RepID=A0A964WW18_9FLAO|nr:SRPBCC domain-containing protein [Allomuricauda ochracea]NAY90338.1 hypothetical protein [Allomuricauda ochracea]
MGAVVWKIHLNASPDLVFQYLTTQEGLEQFWAEKALEKDGMIHFHFPNGQEYRSKTLHIEQNKEFHIDYFDSLVKFVLEPSQPQGTDLILINEGVAEDEYLEVHAGWVSVLLTLKAAVDHNCDLRNHDKTRTWDQKYVNN